MTTDQSAATATSASTSAMTETDGEKQDGKAPVSAIEVKESPPTRTYGSVRIEIDKTEKLVMRKINVSWGLSFQVAHDKFRERPNPVCHAV